MSNRRKTDDERVLDHLADAAALYERYLELARVAQIPLPDDSAFGIYGLPPRTDTPLTLTIRADQ
ncbi:MAG: hypothetical protein EPO26_07385 [Chloroflexota bacterium]|nr:MAG: hypothetical protein EPO26_07385 [Chloroflexota bacterium]